MIERPGARQAYVKAEVATALAHQIRALRMQRGWTQRQLAQRLETSISVVSRCEDPSYGKLSLQTLLDLSRVFDVGLCVKFVSLIDMVRDTFVPKLSERYVTPFEDDSQGLGFVADIPATTAVVHLGGPTAATETALGLLQLAPADVLPVKGPHSISIRL